MNENDYTDLVREIFAARAYGKSKNNSWIDEAGYRDMAYSYSKDYRNDNRGNEVATAVLEAYSKGIDFETLLKQNIQVRAYWKEILKEKVSADQAKEKEKIRLAKLAAKRAEEKAKREEVMSKLTPEELEAFGLVKQSRKVTKR